EQGRHRDRRHPQGAELPVVATLPRPTCPGVLGDRRTVKTRFRAVKGDHNTGKRGVQYGRGVRGPSLPRTPAPRSLAKSGRKSGPIRSDPRFVGVQRGRAIARPPPKKTSPPARRAVGGFGPFGCTG